MYRVSVGVVHRQGLGLLCLGVFTEVIDDRPCGLRYRTVFEAREYVGGLHDQYSVGLLYPRTLDDLGTSVIGIAPFVHDRFLELCDE